MTVIVFQLIAVLFNMFIVSSGFLKFGGTFLILERKSGQTSISPLLTCNMYSDHTQCIFFIGTCK